MDIEISSNLERLLFELLDGNGAATAELLSTFRATGRATLTAGQHERLRAEFCGARVDDEGTLASMAAVHDRIGMTVDPHTAVGIAVSEQLRAEGETVITLASAHPAKFPDAVEQATGTRPELPPHLADIMDRPERVERLPADLTVVEDFVNSVRRR